MRFEAVPEFLDVYDGLADRELSVVGAMLERLVSEHDSPWARQGIIRGDRNAWIAVGGEWRLYWEYRDEGTIRLLALIRRR